MIFKKDKSIYAPISGEYVPLKDVNDTTFSTGLMGSGLAFDPIDGTVISPFSGRVTMFFPTKHAIGLKRQDGLEVLIHVGIETVNLQGGGFTQIAQKNDAIKKGSPLLKFDKQFIIEKKLDPTVIMVLTNGADYDLTFNDLKGLVNQGDVIGNAKRR
ncbi:PTS sugar transporter subunit IIA [Enterococcus casseliflavus]|uniref:PTS sugar transporter subunit IIA n=1 Tax=Enterococcus casseliflavus TaxID=37734 RepID=UPI001432CA89|nr:PTS glucose transporter subunit IIA [Enterococcus casseliflavus]NKD30973.1 PTS glucose transporter subunit IIA [Enterococcus casseliflavus]NKD34165.1 PTS glucose transporter subunit IIA [Enterococcus casseliflavus]